jgi:predicted transposase/invertase (TIGR01784 family)
MELHFLELPKLQNSSFYNTKEKVIEWMKFLNANTKGEMEVLAKNNQNIGKAYKILEDASRNESKRLAYEARQAAIMDEMSKINEAKEEGKKEGIKEGVKKGEEKKAIKIAIKLLNQDFSIEEVSKITEISIDVLNELSE